MNQVILQDCKEIFDHNILWKKLYGKAILITGAYGMLASYVTDMLIYLNEYQDANIKIIVFVRSENKCKLRFGEYADKSYFTTRTDSIENPIAMDENIDFIIHAASLASPSNYTVRPIEVIAPNVIGTYNLLNLAVEKRVEGFLLFSTGSAYGKVSGVEAITEDTCGVLDPLSLRACYSESKRIAETWCKAFSEQKGIPAKIVRIWHTYAPTMDYENDPRVFASFVNDIINRRDIIMMSDGMAKRSFCYITDAVAGFFLTLLEGKPGEAYNVCNENEWRSILELAEIMTGLCPELGLKVIKKERNPEENYIENSAANFIPSSSKKLRELGWEAKVLNP